MFHREGHKIILIFLFVVIFDVFLIEFILDDGILKTSLQLISILILILISLYRIADIVMGVMANIFYLEKGYKISDIATYSKFFGVFFPFFQISGVSD